MLKILQHTKFIQRMIYCSELLQKYHNLKYLRNKFCMTNHGQSCIDYTALMIELGAKFNRNKTWFMKHVKIEYDILYIENRAEELKIMKYMGR